MQLNTIGGMATIKSRLSTLEAVLDSIVNQLSILYVYFNDHKEVPRFISKYRNVVAILGVDSYGDLNANAKMYFMDYEESGIAFTLDDDIIYPSNYVSRMLAMYSRYPKGACLSVHGSVIPDHASWYYERKIVYGFQNAMGKSNIVNLIGSGTAVFPVGILHNYNFDYKNLIYVDLQITLASLHSLLPVVVVSRPSQWLKSITYEGLWQKFSKTATHHTHILLKHNCWKSSHLRQIWKDVFECLHCNNIANPGRYLDLSQESIGFVNGEPLGSPVGSAVQLITVTRFTDLWVE